MMLKLNIPTHIQQCLLDGAAEYMPTESGVSTLLTSALKSECDVTTARCRSKDVLND